MRIVISNHCITEIITPSAIPIELLAERNSLSDYEGEKHEKDIFYLNRNKTLFWFRLSGTGHEGIAGKRTGQ